MLFFTQILSCISFLLLFLFCFHKCFGAIEENRFTFLKTISKDETQNVYWEFTVPYRRNHILTCSANCGIDENCIGIDICDARICRLWNLTIYQNMSANNSNKLCKRYIKVIFFSYFNACCRFISICWHQFSLI